MNVTVCGPNLNDQSKGQFHIHAADCADLTRHARREPEYENGWTIEATSVRSVVEDVYSDMIFHNDQDPWTDFVSDLHFFPCCNGLPLDSVEEEDTDEDTDDLDDPHFDEIQDTLQALVDGIETPGAITTAKRRALVDHIERLSELIGVPIEQED